MIPSDQRKQRRYITAVFFFLAGIIGATWSSRIPDVQQKLGLNNAALGLVLFALPAGLVLGLLLSGWLVARFGTQKIMVISCIISAFLLCLLGLANLRGQLMVVLFFVGFTRTVMNIAINTNAVEVQRLYEKPIISTFHGIWSVACLIAAVIGTVMILFNVIPLIHFIIIGGLCILGVFLHKNKLNSDEHIAPESRPFLVMPDKYLWLLGLIAFCVMAGENTAFEWSINYFDQVVKAEKAFLTLGYICFIIAMSSGRLLGDRLIHRFGHANMLLVNGVVMSSGFILAALIPSTLFAAFGFFLVGLGDSIVVPIVYTLAARSSKMPANYAIASVTLIGYTGFLVAPLINGTVSQIFGMQWAFLFVGLLALCISLLTLMVKKLM